MTAFPALVLQASVVAFAPPPGIPFHVTSERIDAGAIERRVVMERVVRFLPEPGGYRGEVRVLASAATPQAIGGMIDVWHRALAGQTVVVHLDGAGRLLAVDDLAAVWGRVCDGVGAVVANRKSLTAAERAALEKRFAGSLRAMPPALQREMLGSLVTALIPGEAVAAPGTIEPVHLPGASPFGQPITLDGTRRTIRLDDGRIEMRTHAVSDIPVAAERGADARTGHVDLQRVQRTDPLTGLLAYHSETTATVSGAGADAQKTVRTTMIRIETAPGWPAPGF